MTDWQPIDTAPKDGRPLILCRYGSRMSWSGFWRANRQAWGYYGSKSERAEDARQPELWMPMPVPPPARVTEE